MIPDLNTGHTLSDLLHDTSGLVPEHRRAARLRRTVDRVVVGVADAARVQAHEHLLVTRWRELEVAHAHRTAGPLQHRPTDLHATDSGTCSRRSSSSGMWQRMS